MKWWCAAVSAVCLLLPPPSTAADDLPEAARELARKTASVVGRGESVAVTWRNASGQSSSDLARVRGVYETALREAGVRTVETAGAEARITLSENPSHYLLVEELRRGDDRHVWIAEWKRSAASNRTV